MMMIYTFSSTDAAELAATALRRRVPLLHAASVEEAAPADEPEPFAFFPVNSVSVSGPVNNYYPTLFAFNAYTDAPPFSGGLLEELEIPEYAEAAPDTARLVVSCDPRDARQCEVIALQMGGRREKRA